MGLLYYNTDLGQRQIKVVSGPKRGGGKRRSRAGNEGIKQRDLHIIKDKVPDRQGRKESVLGRKIQKHGGEKINYLK